MIKKEKNNQLNVSTKDKVLHSAAILFLERGYEKTSIRDIADHAGVNRGSVMFAIKSKEHLLEILTAYVLEQQFEASRMVIAGKTDDKLLHYAAETTMQLYMAESRRQVRELYAVAYAMPGSSELIYTMMAERLKAIFGEYNPGWDTCDFFEKEIATGSIIRGYMARPCDECFTIERKVAAFLKISLMIYNVPEDKINEALNFVSQMDFEIIANNTIEHILNMLKNKKGI